MSLKGVDIRRGTVGASVLGNTDAISGLLATGAAVAADAAKGVLGIALGQTVKLTSLADAAGYGITAEYDATNQIRVYRHIEEFFRVAGEGRTLYLMLYTGTPSAALSAQYAKKMIADADGEIRQLAVAYSPGVDYDDVMSNGIEKDIYDAIVPAQQFAEWAYDTLRPCQVILEGRGFSAQTATAAADLRALEVAGTTIEAYKVSLFVGQDWEYAETQNAVGKNFADVGTMLGMLSLRSVSENIGQVTGGNISNALQGKWLTAGLSDHKKITEHDADIEALDDKGYVFAMRYPGIAGLYFNNDHTCTPIVKDKDGRFNEYTISYGRAHDKAARELRSALLPVVKSTQPVDAKTGLLPQSVVTYFERLGDDVFASMTAQGDITAGKTAIDANSDLLISPRTLKVSFTVVPRGQVDMIAGVINLKTSI